MKRYSWLSACSSLALLATGAAAAVPAKPQEALEYTRAVEDVRRALLNLGDGEAAEPPVQLAQWGNWPNWGNWNNWNNWRNWGNWGNWGNY